MNLPARAHLAAFVLALSCAGLGAQQGTQAAEPAVPAAAYVIPIEGEIDRALLAFVRRAVQKAQSGGVGTIVFEIDTFGGRADSALQIATQIGALEEIRTVAFVPASPTGTGVSWSAGALIAFSCGEIYMAPGTSIGAAAPVYQTGEGAEAAPEKAVSAVRAQMAALAEKNGYPKSVAMAMVDMDVELLEVYLGEELMVVTAADLPDLERQARREGRSLEKGRVISPPGKLLTLTAGEMQRYGVSSATVPDLEALTALLGIPSGEIRRLSLSLADRLVAFITSGAVTGLLVLVGLVALYLEISSPGFGIPGTLAIIAFAVVFLGGALLGTAGSLEIVLFLLGVILLVVEIFLIPGFGVTGISGILLMIVSLVLSRQEFIVPRFDWEWDVVLLNLRSIGLAFLASLVLAAVLFRGFRRLPLFRRLILDSAENAREGYTVQGQEISRVLVGRKGTALTALRPAGKAEFEGEAQEEALPVETDGEYLEAGTQVEIIEVSGNRVVVRRVQT